MIERQHRFRLKGCRPGRAFWALPALFALSGCLDVPGGTPRVVGFTRAAPQTIAVAGGAVVIGGPRGYCIDRAGSRPGGETAFVLLGSCASISRNANAPAPDFPGVLTASVTRDSGAAPSGAAALQQLERYLASPEGRAMLARDGQASSVDILETRLENGAIFIHLRDRSANATDGLADTYWRALFLLNGRLITLSVFGAARQPLSDETGLATARGFLARIRRESQSAVAAIAPADAAAPRKGLLLNLFE